MMLDVYVQDRRVGVLSQTGVTSFVFTYLPDVPQELSISLLMPPRAESWTGTFLFPVFQVSLPEGALRQILERSFAKNFPTFGDMELLAIVGENLIGQLKVVPHNTPLSGRSIHESLHNLLSSDLKSVVEHYLGEGSRHSGVSGGIVKFLARSPVEGNGAKHTLAIDQWVVKLNDADHPDIVLLEHFGMMVAREMGLDVPETHLAPDFSRLLVKRFDMDDQRRSLGFEDMCALMGLPSRDKFSGSVERIVRTIRAFCPGYEGTAGRERFYAQYLLAAAIRNGDAHLKNFGLVYEPGHIPRLAPVYDMLSMAVYAPRDNRGDAYDGMALTLGGTKRWPKANALKSLAQLCGVLPNEQIRWHQRLSQALLKTAEAVLAFEQQHHEHGFGKQAARMLELWSHGVRPVSGDAATELAKYSEAVAAVKASMH